MVDIPNNLNEALHLLDKFDVTIIAGGTDLMVQRRSYGGSLPSFDKEVLFIRNLKDLSYIKQVNGWIKIGANTTLETLLQHELTPQIYKDALYEMASINIRNEATIAGNIENASPAGDSLPILYALDATIVLQSKNSKREVLIKDYITDVRTTIKEPNELITEIKFKRVSYTTHKWMKVGGRKADAISKVSFAGLAFIKDNKIKDIRIALGAVSKTIIRRPEIEQLFCNITVTELQSRIDEIIKLYDPYIRPINDQRSNKSYRRKISHNMISDFVVNL